MFPVDWTDNGTTDKEARTKSLYARGGDVYLIIHHAFNRTVFQTIDTFNSTYRQVAANFAMGPKTAGVDECFTVRTVPESERAYTTSSWIDDQAITVECSNLDLAAPYPVGASIKHELAALAAYMHLEYGMPLDAWHITDHSGVYARGWGSYPTSCCGDDLRGAIGWIIEEAKRIVAAGGSTNMGDIMARYTWAPGRAGAVQKGEVGGVYHPRTPEEAAVLSKLYGGIDITDREWDVAKQASMNIAGEAGLLTVSALDRELDAVWKQIADRFDDLDDDLTPDVDEPALAAALAPLLAEHGIEAEVDAEALAQVFSMNNTALAKLLLDLESQRLAA